MPRAKAQPRVKGPYSERGGTRFRIRICDVTEHRDLYFSTMQEARAGMKEAAREFPSSGNGRALGKIVDEYTDDKVKRGLCTARSASRYRDHLRTWLCDYLDKDIDKLTPKRAAALYERMVLTPTGKTGRPPSAATQRYYLQLAQMLFRWAIRKGYLRESPFANVQPRVTATTKARRTTRRAIRTCPRCCARGFSGWRRDGPRMLTCLL